MGLVKYPEDTIEQLELVVFTLKKFRLDIEKALCYGNNAQTFDNVVARVLRGELDLYILERSIVIMELFEEPNFNEYFVYIVAGDLQELLEFQRGHLLHEARLRNCKYLGFSGRNGWVRTLKNEGWEQKLVIMSKEVPYGED